MARWVKQGCIFCPEGSIPWMRTHASNPTALRLQGNEYRIFFSGRDGQGRSSVGFLDLDITCPRDSIRLNDNPILTPGMAGLFDDSGASVACIATHGGQYYLYYLGWNLGRSVPFRNAIGLAVADNPDGPFHKASPAPVLDRNHHDPLSLSYPWVMVEQERWRMWYGSHLSWEEDELDMRHVIKYTESSNGMQWNGNATTAVGLQQGESGLSRPCVVRDEDGMYHMWYAKRIGRNITYAIGYATSHDGHEWRRCDNEAGISASKEGWDSEMICYPYVFTHQDTRYMLYNGNGFGKTGFGLAIWEK